MTSRRIDDAGISARYGVLPKDAAAWAKLLNFPAADGEGLRDLDRVDAWVQAMRPQYWPPKSEAVSAAGTPGTHAAKPMTTDRPAPATESRSEMAKRFNMSYAAVDAWTRANERRNAEGKVVATAFPPPVSEGRWDKAAVDTWVRANRARVWTAYAGSEPQFVKPLPEGHPKDLLGISEYGVIRGNALSGKPAQRRTMQAYLLRGQIAPPDRVPKDRKRPEVFEPMWYRETIYSEIRRRLTRGASEAGGKPLHG
jgi:predicted DNA-binding transcriptional regulator AlpA